MAIEPHYITGKSAIGRRPGAAGSEGPWHWDAGCNEVVLPGENGDPWIVWASSEPSVTGNGTLSGEIASGGMWMLTFTGAGPVTLGGASIVAHRITGVVLSECG